MIRTILMLGESWDMISWRGIVKFYKSSGNSYTRIAFVFLSIPRPLLYGSPFQDERPSIIDPNLLVLPPYEMHVVQTRKIPGRES